MAHMRELATFHFQPTLHSGSSGDGPYGRSDSIQHLLHNTFGAADMSTSTDTALRIQRADHLHLAALVSTVTCSRLFVRQVCASWQISQTQTDDAELLTSELVSNAIAASGVTGPRRVHGSLYSDVKLIGMRLLDLGDSIAIEIWDTSLRPPKLIAPSPDAEHGRGLHMVDALSIRWGYYFTRIGTKVVWCQLALDADISAGSAGDHPEAFKRVAEVLQAHPWDEIA
jgi:anti-sigma regulatory factor (Ser/Thr protein kinase)